MASKKIVIFLREKAAAAYARQLAEEEMNPSAFFTRMLLDREAAYKEKNTRNPVGRPKTKESEEERMNRIQAEPKDTKHPAFDEAFGGHRDEICTRREAEAWCAWMDGNDDKRAWAQALPYYIPKDERIMND